MNDQRIASASFEPLLEPATVQEIPLIPLGTFLVGPQGTILQFAAHDSIATNEIGSVWSGCPLGKLWEAVRPQLQAAEYESWSAFETAATAGTTLAAWYYSTTSELYVHHYRLTVRPCAGSGPITAIVDHEKLPSQVNLSLELSRSNEASPGHGLVLQELIRKLPIGIIMAEAPSGKLLLASEMLEGFLGRPMASVDRVEDYRVLPNFHPDGRRYEPEDYPIAQAVRYGRVVKDQPMVVRRADGSERLLSVSGGPLRDSDGNVVAAISAFIDITEQRESLAELQRTKERFQRAAETGRVGVWEIDLHAEPMYLSPNLKAMLGYTDEELPNTREAWCNTLHPDDKPEAMRLTEAYFAGEITAYSVEARRLHKNGSILWFLVQGTVLRDANGVPRTLVGSDTDITPRRLAEEALRESEERLRLGLEAGQTGLWDWDVAKGTVAWSDRIYEIHGLTREQFDGTFESFARWVHPDDVGWVQERLLGALNSEETYEVEFRIRRPDGEVRWISTAGQTKLGADGRPVRMVGATSDVTDRRGTEAEREALLESERAARAEMERALRVKDEFLATLSHELRTPLNSILGWATLLRSNGLDPDLRQEGIAAIERNARIQTQIVEDLLDMSRIVAGKLQLKMHQVSLSDIVQSAVQTVRPAAEARGIRINVDLPDHLQPIWGDSGRLQQVMWNLLSNAVKFASQEGTVEIKVRELVASGGETGDWRNVELAVRDDGEGIDPAFLPHVFERFRQADSSTTRRHGGLGLGLAIVKQLVELHGGRIRVESKGKGDGATFIVTLPGQLQSPTSMPVMALPLNGAEPLSVAAMTAALQASTSFTPLEGRHLLVVDDEPDTLNLVTMMLELAGAEVTPSYSARNAREKLQEQSFDALICDISMPEEDGYNFIRRLRQSDAEYSGMPALALTAFARPEDRDRALAAGFNSHHPKPVEASSLTQTVLQMLQTEATMSAATLEHSLPR